ncbi:hypothetical protein ACFQ4E_14700 [Litorisediminicola beolgyonensis]|uniref:Uncharacterized protein n=1 Tax=Litorisediminicola beolgyonensis TaxID=1173614 RepID=A0ABW3ZKJ1_9RHOB
MTTLRSEMGTGLPLQETLRILPRPQCGVLDGIDRLGLPQSEEQLTYKQLIGENAHVREYASAERDRMVIDLVAPDYPAFVYFDYFDADGQVTH